MGHACVNFSSADLLHAWTPTHKLLLAATRGGTQHASKAWRAASSAQVEGSDMLQERDGQGRQEPVPSLCAGSAGSHFCCPVLKLRRLVPATGQGMSQTGSEQCSQTATACIWSPRLPWLQRLPPCRLWRSGICSRLSAGAPPEGAASNYSQQSEFAFRATTAVRQSNVVAVPLIPQQLL